MEGLSKGKTHPTRKALSLVITYLISEGKYTEQVLKWQGGQ